MIRLRLLLLLLLLLIIITIVLQDARVQNLHLQNDFVKSVGHKRLTHSNVM